VELEVVDVELEAVVEALVAVVLPVVPVVVVTTEVETPPDPPLAELPLSPLGERHATSATVTKTLRRASLLMRACYPKVPRVVAVGRRVRPRGRWATPVWQNAMESLRTPESRFRNLPGFPYGPRYQEVGDGLRMAYIDEGPRDGRIVLMLHGEPTWSYLYRKMIPVFTAAGMRAIAPDLIGFGRSDKPVRRDDYTYARHVEWVRRLLESLAVRDVTLVAQDWGSLIGLRVAAENHDWFGRIVIANGFLPTADRKAPFAFHAWRAFSQYSPLFPIGRIVASGCVTKPTSAERRAYDAPFPSSEYKAGARVFPALVPITRDNPAVPANLAAWEILGRWEKPFLTLFGKNDPILGNADRPLQRHVPGAKGQPHERFWGGHFVQEDRGDYLASAIVKWMNESRQM